MRGTGEVMIGNAKVYAYVTADGSSLRLRLSIEECDRLDLFAGRQVRVAFPGRSASNALVTAVVPQPPFAWVEAELLAGVAHRAS